MASLSKKSFQILLLSQIASFSLLCNIMSCRTVICTYMHTLTKPPTIISTSLHILIAFLRVVVSLVDIAVQPGLGAFARRPYPPTCIKSASRLYDNDNFLTLLSLSVPPRKHLKKCACVPFQIPIPPPGVQSTSAKTLLRPCHQVWKPDYSIEIRIIALPAIHQKATSHIPFRYQNLRY